MPTLWDMHTHVYAVSPMTDLPLYIAYGAVSFTHLTLPTIRSVYITRIADTVLLTSSVLP